MQVTLGFFCRSGSKLDAGRLGERLAPGCRLATYSYESHEQLERLFWAEQRGLDGALFDSDLALRYLTLRADGPMPPCAAALPGAAELLHALLTCQREDPGLRLSRVLVDVGANRPLEELLPIERRPVFLAQEVWGDPATWEDGTLRRYQTAWGSGLFDLLLTQRVSLLERLERIGIAARGLPPSADSALRALERLCVEALSQRLRAVLPSCGVVGTRGGTAALEPLGGALEQFNAERGNCLLISRRSGLYELQLSNRLLLELTAGYTDCRLLAFLKYHLDAPVCIGWGVGEDAHRAHENAERAYRESLFDRRNHSYIVDAQGTLMGPLTGQAAPILDGGLRAPLPERLLTTAREAGLAPASLLRVVTLLEQAGTDRLTAAQLAHHLGVTQRTAARLLARLEQAGLARSEPLSGARGRPSKLYRVHF